MFRDGAFGYSLSYPSSWVEVTAVSRPGSDFFASRPGVATARDLGAGDRWLSARRFAPDATIGCGAPSDGFSKLAGYGGRSWGLYSRQNGPSNGMSVADAVTVLDGWCYALQLIAGPGAGPDATLDLLDSIGQTFNFNVQPAQEPIAPPVGQRHLVATPGHSAPNWHVLITGHVLALAPILLDSRPRCISAVGPPMFSPGTGDLSVDVTMGSVFSGAGCPRGDVEVIIWVGYVPYDAVVVVDLTG